VSGRNDDERRSEIEIAKCRYSSVFFVPCLGYLRCSEEFVVESEYAYEEGTTRCGNHENVDADCFTRAKRSGSENHFGGVVESVGA
jgi:hypothetical protein